MKALKKSIKKKYGSLSQFARLAGIDRTRLQILFAVKNPDRKFLATVKRKVATVTPEPAQELLTPKKLKALQTAINDAGGVGTFCKDSGFSRDTVNQIVAGRYKTVSVKVKALLDHFEIV